MPFHHSASDPCDAASIGTSSFQASSGRTSSDACGWASSLGGASHLHDRARPSSSRMGCGADSGRWCTVRPAVSPGTSPSPAASYGSCSPLSSRGPTPPDPSSSQPSPFHRSGARSAKLSFGSAASALPSLAPPAESAAAPAVVAVSCRHLLRQAINAPGGAGIGDAVTAPPPTVRPLSEVRLPNVAAAATATAAATAAAAAATFASNASAVHAGRGSAAAAAGVEAAWVPLPLPQPHRLAGERSFHVRTAQAPAPAGATPAREGSLLLAVSPGLPEAMRRPKWSLQDYDVSWRIYKGSTSAVYKATCRYSGMPVALKVYFLSRVPANVIHMILREIKIHSSLDHANIITLYGAFQEERRLVLVQEYASRGDLHDVFRGLQRRITEAELGELVLAPFLEALCCLHGRGLCHRDIKPENVLLTHDWRCVMADFGVSVDLAQERAVTRAGTLEYMAPEVERCPLKMFPEENKDKPFLAYTTAVDIWATGVLAYELLVGFPPFCGDADAASHAPPTRGSVLHFPPNTSAAARSFICAALSERPEDRPTAFELRRHPWITSALGGGGAAAAADDGGHRC